MSALLWANEDDVVECTDCVLSKSLDVGWREAELEGNIANRTTTHHRQNRPGLYVGGLKEDLLGAPCCVCSLRGYLDVCEGH